MGLLLLSCKKHKCPVQVQSVSHKTAKRNYEQQIEGLIVRTTTDLTFGFIYCRSTPTEPEINAINDHFKECDILMGDLNLSHRISSDQRKLETLCKGAKVNALKEITRSISFNHSGFGEGSHHKLNETIE